MCIARQYVFIFKDRCWYRIPFSIIDLNDTFRNLTQELRIMELMSSILFPVKNEATIAQREFAICLACCNLIGEDTTHGKLAFIGNDAIAEIHHATTFGHDMPTTFGKLPDQLTTGFVTFQSFQMLLWIAARKIK